MAQIYYLAVLLLLFLAAVYSGRIRIDFAALLLLLALALPVFPGAEGARHGVLEPAEAFAGFGSPAVAMVVAMFVISAAMDRTGAATWLAGGLLERAASSERRLLWTVVGAVTLFSAFVSDTTSVLVWMPLVLSVCRQRGYSGARVLLPLAYAALLGGQWTLIGTRTNVVLSDFLREQTGEGLGFLSFTPIAVLIWIVVASFLVLIGRHFLPSGAEGASLADRYEVKEYFTEVMVDPRADMVGRNLGELDLERTSAVRVLSVIRGDEHLPPEPYLVVHSGDVLVVQGRISQIQDLLHRQGVEVREELRVKDVTLRSADLRLVEALIAPGSELEGASLAELEFHRSYGLTVLAVSRGGRALTGRPVEERLRVGDSLLLVGHEEMIRKLRHDPAVHLLESRPLPVVGRAKAQILLGILASMVVVSALRLVPASLAVCLAAATAVATGGLGMRAAYEAVDWRIVFVLGGMIPFGHALESTGGAELLASKGVELFGSQSPELLFSVLCFATLITTQVLENTAAAVLLAPVSYELALATGASPAPFLLGTALCASAGFASPIAHECTLLVLGPGGYRPRHFLALGIPAALLCWLVVVLAVPWVYPLAG